MLNCTAVSADEIRNSAAPFPELAGLASQLAEQWQKNMKALGVRFTFKIGKFPEQLKAANVDAVWFADVSGAIAFTKKYLPQFKSEIVSEDYYKDGETDFRPVLAKIKASSGVFS